MQAPHRRARACITILPPEHDPNHRYYRPGLRGLTADSALYNGGFRPPLSVTSPDDPWVSCALTEKIRPLRLQIYWSALFSGHPGTDIFMLHDAPSFSLRNPFCTKKGHPPGHSETIVTGFCIYPIVRTNNSRR